MPNHGVDLTATMLILAGTMFTVPMVILTSTRLILDDRTLGELARNSFGASFLDGQKKEEVLAEVDAHMGERRIPSFRRTGRRIASSHPEASPFPPQWPFL